MPWEAPLQSILQSIEGPVARIVAVIVIVLGTTSHEGDDLAVAQRRDEQAHVLTLLVGRQPLRIRPAATERLDLGLRRHDDALDRERHPVDVRRPSRVP